MLSKLIVSNLAVVEKAEASFAPGLNVITGETGAGKSVLMGALELVLGGRADPAVVREGAKEAEVEAEFGEHTVRRTVTAQGRSRVWIDDESVTVAELRDFARGLVDIHGPRANQNLLEENFQREALDLYGKVSLDDYAAEWAKYRAIADELEVLEDEEFSEDEVELLRFQVNELEEAALSEDDDTIAERHAAAAHSEEIVEGANEITEAIGGDDHSAVETLARLQPRCAALAKHLPEAENWARELDEVTIRLEELSRAVADAASKIEVDPDEFKAMDDRLAVVNRLKRKFKAVDVAGLLAILAAKKTRLEGLENREGKIAELRARLAAAEKAVRSVGATVTKARAAAGAKLAKAITKELRDLGFREAKFSVAIEPAEPSASGVDKTVYLFEPNPGESARPLAAIASSGEIARVMLALKSVLAAHDSVGTLVFDEIDANIGGEVGRVVGEKMRAVAANRQVIAITHLPQSAVWGERHLVVAKTVAGGRTRTNISEVEGEARVKEIARMLGGEKLTSVVKIHAEELLKGAV